MIIDKDTEKLLNTLNFTLEQLGKTGIRLYDRQNYEYFVSQFHYNNDRNVIEFDTELDEDELERTCDLIRIEHEKSSSLTTTKDYYREF